MNIVISPAKRMRNDIAYLKPTQTPIYLKQTKHLLHYIKTLTLQELQAILECNIKIAEESFQAYKRMSLKEEGSPALLAFDGIQYTYMAPSIFFDETFAYVQQHVFILSGFYGVLHPFDAVVPYRLELNNKFVTPFCSSLYEYWKDLPYQEVTKHDHDILDLTSKQYARIINKYLQVGDHMVRCRFYEDEEGKYREKGVYVKMARGEMVRYLAQIEATSFEEVKTFSRLGYHYREDLSNWNTMVFVRKNKRT
ncbi:MAG: peroxide stress protein YaaA [Longicatena sp.]